MEKILKKEAETRIENVKYKKLELETLVKFELETMDKNKKTYKKEGNIFFLVDREEITEIKKKELEQVGLSLKNLEFDLFKLNNKL
jgi:chaperonin cofactor prefoldin